MTTSVMQSRSISIGPKTVTELIRQRYSRKESMVWRSCRNGFGVAMQKLSAF